MIVKKLFDFLRKTRGRVARKKRGWSLGSKLKYQRFYLLCHNGNTRTEVRTYVSPQFQEIYFLTEDKYVISCGDEGKVPVNFY